MLSAMVFVARGALARAEEEATRGAEIQRGGAGTDRPFRPPACIGCAAWSSRRAASTTGP